MGSSDMMRMARQERGELLGLLRTLTVEQWSAPSLCDGWSVRHVAVHVVSYEELSLPALALLFLRGGLQPDKVNDVALRTCAGLTPAEVIDLYERHQHPRGLTSALGGRIALTDGTIHHQDIRRALHLPRSIPAERLVAVLEFSLKAPTLPSRKHRRGLRVQATDCDFAVGTGPDLTGPGEALLMALAGRHEALEELSGPGLPLLHRRLIEA
ncbi:maleylpyruvate isomerase family mycothiol-dependent enzyme [Nocardioides korecus]